MPFFLTVVTGFGVLVGSIVAFIAVAWLLGAVVGRLIGDGWPTRRAGFGEASHSSAIGLGTILVVFLGMLTAMSYLIGTTIFRG